MVALQHIMRILSLYHFYLGTTLTNQECVHKEIKNKLNSTFLFSILSSCLLSKNFKIQIYETINLPVVLYGCETWCPILKEEQ
jgi:hypothetical protein